MEEKKLWSLFESMTLAEKLGQMTQTTGEFFVSDHPEFKDELVVTGPAMEELGFDEENLFTVGSVLGVSSSKVINTIQEKYLAKSRLKIPLLFMHDAIHGYRTIFPIPLALASSFDEAAVLRVADLTARELRATGIHVDFSPMVDLVRDARWGRVMESFGEDALLSGRLGDAMILGYQGGDDGTVAPKHVAACLKHFAAYGAPDAGRDYASVDLSDKEFYGFYAKSYQLALQANPRMVMASFNSINGEPVTASQHMLSEVLRERFGFSDLIISDWGAVSELKNHGVAASDADAGQQAMSAGIEIEMVSNSFMKYGEDFVKAQPDLLEKINSAVWELLNLKNELGLFEHPFADEAVEAANIRTAASVSADRKIAQESCVLLKNDQDVLPLSVNEKILLVGPFAKTHELLGNWNCKGRADETVSVLEGLLAAGAQVSAYEKLADVPENELISADKVVVTIGEAWDHSGEGHSSSNLELDLEQQALIHELKKQGKTVIALGFAGRPLALGSVIDDLDALLWTWYLGNEAGDAIADLLLGKNTPTGRLPMSFPRVSAQVPLRYNELRSGRPANASFYSSRYQDIPIGPLFPFGYGLRYGKVTVENVEISDLILSDENPIEISVTVRNDSNFDTQESLLLFMEDAVAKLVRPVRELIDFTRVYLRKGEAKVVTFPVTTEMLSYINAQGEQALENGAVRFYLNDLQNPVTSVEVEN